LGRSLFLHAQLTQYSYHGLLRKPQNTKLIFLSFNVKFVTPFVCIYEELIIMTESLLFGGVIYLLIKLCQKVRRLKDNKKYNIRHGNSKAQIIQGRKIPVFRLSQMFNDIFSIYCIRQHLFIYFYLTRLIQLRFRALNKEKVSLYSNI